MYLQANAEKVFFWKIEVLIDLKRTSRCFDTLKALAAGIRPDDRFEKFVILLQYN